MKHHDPAMDEPLPDATEVRQAYDALPDTNVPADLDARILARARDAVSKPSTVVELKQPTIKRWAIPLAAAASVVMVMSVVYEMQFNPAHNSAAIVSKLEAPATSVPGLENRAIAPAAPASDEVIVQLVKPLAEPPAEVLVAPMPAPVPAPSTSMADASPSAPIALDEALPPPPAAPDVAAAAARERTTTTSERYQDSKAAARNEVNAIAGQSQLAGKVAKQAEAAVIATPLARLAGYYNYDTYALTLAGGQVLSLKELGATTATLDINEQGTLTLRMSMLNGKTLVQSAKILDAKLAGNSGYWIAQWPDMSYPVTAHIVIDGDKLTSNTRFEERSDAARFGSVEQATLRRIGSR